MTHIRLKWSESEESVITEGCGPMIGSQRPAGLQFAVASFPSDLDACAYRWTRRGSDSCRALDWRLGR